MSGIIRLPTLRPLDKIWPEIKLIIQYTAYTQYTPLWHKRRLEEFDKLTVFDTW